MPFPAFPPRPATRLSSHGLRKLLVLSAAAIVSSCAQLPSVEDAEARQRAELAEQARQAARPTAVCAPTPDSPFIYKKKILILKTPISRPSEAADLPGLSTAWSRELLHELNETERFITRDGSNLEIDPSNDIRPQIIALARQHDAQFVISGHLESLQITRGRIDLGPLKPISNPFSDRRRIAVTLQVYDGYSGTSISRVHHDAEVRGKVDGSSFSTSSTEPPLAIEIKRALTQQREAIEDALACLPMLARVLRVNGNEIQVDAGFTSNIKPGDRFRLVEQLGNVSRGANWTEQSKGEFVVRQVLPEASVGYLDGSLPTHWSAGGFIRAW